MDPSSPASTPTTRALYPEVLGVLAIAASFVAGSVMTWHRLGDLFVDCGRELEVPRRILEGDVLYRDVRYYWGPLAPHVNAALYGVFGVSLETARWSGIVTGALTCAGLYLLVRNLLGRLAAVLVAIAFLHLCAFACLIPIPIFNFVLPFNAGATYGIAAAIWSVHLLLVHARTGKSAELVASALFLLVTLLTRVEVAFAVAVAHAVHGVVNAPRMSIRHAIAYGSVALLAAATYGLFLHQAGIALWRDNLGALGNPASAHYVAVTMGLREGRETAVEIVVSLVTIGGLLAVGWLLSREGARRRLRLPGRTAIAGAAGTTAFAIAFLLPFRYTVSSLPIVLAAVIGTLLYARLRHGDDVLSGRWKEHLILWVFTLACLARIPLRVGPDHYGFFLLPPALACIAILYFDYGPRVAENGWAPRVLPAAGAGLLIGLAAASLRLTIPNLAAASVGVSGPRGHMLFRRDAPESRLIPFLSRWAGARSAIAVPQGTGVLFASGLPSANDAMTSYLPMEIPDDDADARLVARWEADPPEVVLYWNQDMRSDFGYIGFGVDYAVRARQWLFEHYLPVTDPASDLFVLVRARDGRRTSPLQ